MLFPAVSGLVSIEVQNALGSREFHQSFTGILRDIGQAQVFQTPVDQLLWWVRGLPAPDSASRLQLDSQSRLGRLSQSGWTVEYSRYQQVDGLELPQRLQISGHDLLLTLVITDWKPGITE